MTVNFGKINNAAARLIEQYKASLSGGDMETFAHSYKGDPNSSGWWKEFFEVLDAEIDHGVEAICEEPAGRVDYLGNTGDPYWLMTREYMVVVKSTNGNICINYLPGAMQGVKIRSARIKFEDSIYFIRENSDTIIDYPIAWLTEKEVQYA